MNRWERPGTLALSLYSLVSVCVIGYILLSVAEKTTTVSIKLLLITVLLGSIMVYAATKRFELKFLYVAVVVYGLAYLMFTPVFSPIDEAAHFDYVYKIVQEHRLPLLSDIINTAQLQAISGYALPGEGTLQYEAVHPPLYYVLSAIIIWPIHSHLLLSFFVIRGMGLLLLLITLYYAVQTYKLMTQSYGADRNHFLFISLGLLFFTNSSIMTRMLTVSNESLAVCLGSILIYRLIKLLSEQVYSNKEIYIVSLLSGGLVLTKITAAALLFPAVLCLTLLKKYKQLMIYVGIVCCLTIPWFAFNLAHYGHLTSTAEHVAFVKKIVNPGNTDFGLGQVLEGLPYLLVSFWTAQEIQWTGPFVYAEFIAKFISVCLVLYIVSSVMATWRARRDKHLNKNLVLLTLAVSILLSIALIIYGTVSQDVNLLIGRYLYICLVPLVLSAFLLMNGGNHDFLAKFLMLCATLLTLSGLLYYGTQKNSVITELTKLKSTEMSLSNLAGAKQQGLLESADLGTLPERLATDRKVWSEEYTEHALNQVEQVHDLVVLGDNNYQITGPDPYVVLKTDGMPMNEGDLCLVQIVSEDMESNMAYGQLFWQDNLSNFAENRSYKFAVPNNKELIVPIGYHAEWKDSQILLQLRLDMDRLPQGSTFKIDHMTLLKKRNQS